MQNLVITGKGQELTAKLIAGTTTATFTKIATSSHDYSTAILESITELQDVKQTALVSAVSRTDTTIVEVLAKIDNTDLETGYYIKALGLYAEDSDGTEILFGISIEPNYPDYMPPQSGTTVSGISYKLNTKVDNSDQVTVEVNPAASPTMEQFEKLEQVIDTHAETGVYGSDGVHGFRYYNDTLQVKNDKGEWVDIETGGGGISPSNVTNLKIRTGNQKVTLYWSDPGNTIIDGELLCTWKGTKLVQKAGSYPTSVKDGTLILDNQTLNAYKKTGYEINGLTNGTTYYFALFPYSDTGATNINQANRIEGTPQPYKKMTAIIDLSNSNHATCITYADDAVNMTAGSSAWDKFFGHYPVLFKDGEEVGELNPNNTDQFKDGTAADTTSGDAGDVMMAYPRRGLTITTNGTKITISMTDDPDNTEEFEYNAHTRGTTPKDVFYLGSYKGSVIANKLRSLKGKPITASQTIGTFRTQAHANGDGYEQSGFYQLIFRQCMYILKYKDLHSQETVGYGYVLSSHGDGNANRSIPTGGTETWGMDCELIKATNPSYMTDQNHHVKCFGLEDFWGNIWEWIDGLVSDGSRNVLTGNDNFNDAGTGYTNNGNGGVTANIGNYMSKPQGTTKTGFVAKEVSGSETTYFCDYAILYASCVAIFGGDWYAGAHAGTFRLNVYDSASSSFAYVAARLMYL